MCRLSPRECQLLEQHLAFQCWSHGWPVTMNPGVGRGKEDACAEGHGGWGATEEAAARHRGHVANADVHAHLARVFHPAPVSWSPKARPTACTWSLVSPREDVGTSGSAAPGTSRRRVGSTDIGWWYSSGGTSLPGGPQKQSHGKMEFHVSSVPEPDGSANRRSHGRHAQEPPGTPLRFDCPQVGTAGPSLPVSACPCVRFHSERQVNKTERSRMGAVRQRL